MNRSLNHHRPAIPSNHQDLFTVFQFISRHTAGEIHIFLLNNISPTHTGNICFDTVFLSPLISAETVHTSQSEKLLHICTPTLNYFSELPV